MTGNEGKVFGLTLLNLGVFFGIMECWHQFRESSGWGASGWFGLMIFAWIVSVALTKYTSKVVSDA